MSSVADGPGPVGVFLTTCLFAAACAMLEMPDRSLAMTRVRGVVVALGVAAVLVDAKAVEIQGEYALYRKFADLDPAIAMDKAERELERHCLQLASHFFSLLDQLQKKNLVGNVQRSDAACRFTFCRRVAILKRGTTRREERSTEDLDYVDDNLNQFVLPMAKSDIANYLGMRPESISRALRQLESQGLVKNNANGKLTIINKEKILSKVMKISA